MNGASLEVRRATWPEINGSDDDQQYADKRCNNNSDDFERTRHATSMTFYAYAVKLDIIHI